MTEQEMLKRDIDGLRESIRLNWQDLARLNLTPEERSGIRQNTQLLSVELAALIDRLEH